MDSQSRHGPTASRWGSLLVLFGLLLCAATAAAHSISSPPLKRVHTPARSTLRILPRHHQQDGRIVRRSLVVPQPSTLRYDDTVMLTVSLPSLLPYDVHLMVRPNEHLFHPEAKIRYENEEGILTHTEPLRAEDWKMYHGQVIRPNWVDRSWEFERLGYGANEDAVIGHASVMVHEVADGGVKWEGTFDIGGEKFNVLTRDNYDAVRSGDDVEIADIEGGMVVFTNRDRAHDKRSEGKVTQSCGTDRLEYNKSPFNPVRRSGIPYLLGRAAGDTGGGTAESNYIDSIGSNAGCPTDPQLLYMGVMLDCTYTASFANEDAARTNILNKFQTVSDVYRNTFKITLGIITLTVKSATCPSTTVTNEEWNVDCDSNLTMDSRLSYFSTWRATNPEDGVGLWHLMTKCQSNTEVGVAWLGAVCQTSAGPGTDGGTVSGTGVSSATTTEWNVIAHEIGHGLGAIHDCTSGCRTNDPDCCSLSKSTCDAGGAYLMNPTTAVSENDFSPCTLGNICTYIKTKNPDCFVALSSANKKNIISLNQCGNGIVEDGEECDPGNNGTSACCENCKLKSTAKCDPSNGLCCTSACQYAKAGVVCRPAIDSTCDTAESCSGSDAACPADVTTKDGTGCGNGLSCASGHCTSLDLQCQQQGSTSNLTKACGQKNDKSCVVVCKDPTNDRVCQILQANLVDGSPCGYGGRCYNSSCKAGSWTEQLDAMYTQNLQIAIPVTVAVGIVILGIIYQLIRCCFTRRSKTHPGPRAATNTRGGRPPPPPAASHQGYQPLAEPLLTDGTITPKPTHNRGSSGSSDGPHGAAAALPMGQMYSDPYNQAPSSHPSDYNSSYNNSVPAYDNRVQYNQPYDGGNDQGGYAPQQYTQNQGYGQQQGHGQNNWVDERDYNGPNYSRP